MVVSSPDKRVQAAVRKHAGVELAEYRLMVVESAKVVAAGVPSRLTRRQAHTNREDFVKYIIKAANDRGNIATAQKGSRPARKGTISRNVRAILDEIDQEIAATTPSPAPASSDAGEPRPVAVGANHAGSGGVDHPPLGENGNGDGNATTFRCPDSTVTPV